jgi:hypothetical protein
MRPLNLETHPVVATVSNAVGVPEQLGQRPERSRPKAAIFAKHGAARLPNAFSGVHDRQIITPCCPRAVECGS